MANPMLASLSASASAAAQASAKLHSSSEAPTTSRSALGASQSGKQHARATEPLQSQQHFRRQSQASTEGPRQQARLPHERAPIGSHRAAHAGPWNVASHDAAWSRDRDALTDPHRQAPHKQSGRAQAHAVQQQSSSTPAKLSVDFLEKDL